MVSRISLLFHIAGILDMVYGRCPREKGSKDIGENGAKTSSPALDLNSASSICCQQHMDPG